MSAALRRDTLSSFLIPALAAATLALCAPAFCQTLSTAKAKFDSGDYAGAAADFESVVQRGAATERPEAAAFVLRSLSQAGNHSQVVDKYDRILSAARGTQFEGECAFERAKSTQVNAKDTTSALAQYAEVLAKYPQNVFAASGVLYQRGTIELDNLKTPNAAITTFEQAIQSYPSSPFVDDALVKQAEAAVGAERLDVIDSARERLEAMKAKPAMLQKIRLQRGEYMAKVKVSRGEAIREYTKAWVDFAEAGRTEAAALAKIRAADMVPAGDFRQAINIYDEVLASQPKLSAYLRNWALAQKGIYQFQLHEEEAAARTFGDLLALKPNARLRDTAWKYLTGISNPNTTSGVMIVYDRALRFKTADTYLDQVFWDAQRVIAKSKEPFFREFVGDGKVSREERAQMLYRVCFSSFLCGHESEAHDLAENILASLQPEGVTKAQCLYMRAHLLGRAGKWDGAAAEWKTLIDMSPKREILAGAYLEYARALDLADDRLGAALALEELSVRLPARRETAQAGALVEQLLLREPQLRPEVAEQKPLIAAKWREQEKWRPADEDEEPAGIAGGIVPPVRIATKGGAE